MHPDNIYIQALLHNDRALVEELYTRFFYKIKNLILKNGGTAEDAADVLQDALLSIYNRAAITAFELNCPIDAFLYQVCRNKWISILRHRSTSYLVTFTDTERYISIGEDNFAQAAACVRDERQKKLFDDKFDELGTACQQLLKLHWGGMHLKEVAKHLQLSYAYARKKKCNCMAKLMSLIEQSPEYQNLKNGE